MENLLTDRLVSFRLIRQRAVVRPGRRIPVLSQREMSIGREDWQDLLERVRKEDPVAQEQLLERLWPRVSHLILGLCPRRESVEDLAQEIFVKVFARLSQFRGGSFGGWVDQIARRTCYDALRKQRIRPEWTFADFKTDPELTETSEEVHLDLDAAEVLSKLFSMLPAEMAWLLEEVELKERGIGEVADEMGWTRTAARLRLFRARRRLAETFKKWNHRHEE